MIQLVVFAKRSYDKFVRDYRFSCMAYNWRKKNRHNKTFAARYFPIDRVTVGKHTYGMLDIRSFCNEAGEKLQIGNYVSIADNVIFILGGEHQIKTFTTFPLAAYFTRINNNKDSGSKGPIVIEDEVWIGAGALILSGVTIGKGSVVGAGAVVTKNVPPYSVTAGNPAKVIKYRFTEDTLSRIKEIKLLNISENAIQVNFELLYEEIENNNWAIEKIRNLCSLKNNELQK